MAETVKIEIPVSVTDKTASGVASIKKRFSSFDESLDKTLKKLDKLSGTRCKVDLEAGDHASDKIADVDAALQKANGDEAKISISAHDDATGIISSVSDAASALNGEDAVVEAEAEDAATGVLSDVDDRLSELNGETAVVEAEAEDAASGVIDEVSGKAAELDGSTVTVLLQAEDNITGAMGNVASMSTTPIAGAAGVMGASFGVYDSVSTYAGFEAAMSQVQAISGATGSDLDALTAKAKQMGATTKFTATESAEAFNYMAMAGWKTEDMLSGIEGIMNLAAASGEDLATTSDIVTDALTAFGLKASDSTHFADVMAQAAANANTNVSMMGESFKYVGPVAGAMGYTIEDMSLALGLMANANVKSSMAGTALRRAITALANPTEKEATAMEKYGISLTDGAGNVKSLNEVMGDMRKNLSGLSQDEKTAAVSAMFGNQALAGMLAIINASEDDFNKLSDAVNNADGASQQMADTMLDNMQGSFTLMQSAIEGVKNSLGERLAPYFRGIADGITAAMPDAEEAINSFMDKIDNFVSEVKLKITSMTQSEEWQGADLFGKIDIAWDTLIATPFSEWALGDGAELVGGGLKTLFSKALNVIDGDAGITDWAAAAIMAKGGLEAAEGIGKLTSALGKLPGSAGIAVGAGLVIAGAVAAIKLAVDRYNELQIKNNLEEHFGGLALSAEDAAALASQTLDIDNITAELHVAEVAFNESDQLKIKGEAKLNELNSLEWKILHADIITDDQVAEDVKSALEGVRQTAIEKLTKDEEGTNAFVNAILGSSPEASQITQQISGWFSEDKIQVESISNAIGDLLQKSINEGAESIETATAIAILQQKMMEITNGAQMAELKGKMDWLKATSPLAALDYDSWANYVTAAGNMVQDLVNTGYEDYGRMFGVLSQLEYNDPSRHGEIQAIRDTITGAWSNLQYSSLLQGWTPIYDSLQAAYGNEMSQAQGIMNGTDIASLFMNGWGMEQTMEGIVDDIGSAVGAPAQGAFARLFETMLPNAESLQSAIDNAVGPVPQAVMDAYNQAMQFGAMGGNEDAMMQYWASRIRESFGSKEDFIEAIGGQEQFDQYSEGIQEALNRAFTETTADVNYEGMVNSLLDQLAAEKPDWGKVREILAGYGVEISGALESEGINIDGTNVKLTGEVNVEPEGLMGKAESALQGFMSQFTGGVTGAVEALDLGTVSAKATVSDVTTDASEAVAEYGADLDEDFAETQEVSGSANVTTEQTNDADEVYGAVGNALNEAFQNVYNLNATAKIHVNWQLENGSNSVSLSQSGGGGSATFSASLAHSAGGRYVDNFMLSTLGEEGPEYVIPVSGRYRNRGIDLWKQAGEDLGVMSPFEQQTEGRNEAIQALLGMTPNNSTLKGTNGLPSATTGSVGQNNVNVSVNMNPVVQIDGQNLDEEKVVEVMKGRIREMADDVADEVGIKLVKVFENMPLAGGA